MVSVILPTYNRSKSIMESVYSVLNQTYCDLELIIVDDGSNDDTKEKILSINDDRVKYIYQENKGACSARNKGISVAQGDYIAFQDSDDLWYKEKLQIQMEAIKNLKVDVVICGMHLYNGEAHDEDIPKGVEEGNIKDIRDLQGIGTQCILAKKYVFDYERFDVNMPRFQDLELLIRLNSRFNIYFIKNYLVDYHIESDSISNDEKKAKIAIERLLFLYPDLNINYPDMLVSFANRMIRSGNNNKIGKRERMDYYILANKCLKKIPISISFKCRIKIIIKMFLIIIR